MKIRIVTIVLVFLISVTFAQDTAIVWVVDNIKSIGGHPVTLEGAPKVVEKDGHKAVEFNGKTDGLFIDANPMIGASEFTVEVVFMPYSDGNKEQRFLHFQQDNNNRLLVELRLSNGKWFLDSFIKSGSSSNVLYSEGIVHDADTWVHSELVYKNSIMTHYVDGVKELEGDLSYKPVTSGKTSIGVRQNKVSWFRGAIRMVKITHKALTPDEFLINKQVSVSHRDRVRHRSISIKNISQFPYSKSGILNFSVAQTGSYVITLAQPNGTMINQFKTNNLAPGHHRVHYNVNANIPGIYIFSIKGNKTFVSKKWPLLF